MKIWFPERSVPHRLQERDRLRKPPLFRTLLGLFLIALLVACGTPTVGEEDAPAPTPTLPPTPTATRPPAPTSTPVPMPTPTLDAVAHLQEIRANELGQIMVLQYHLIEEPEDRWSRTPQNFRADLERLIAGGYYPINLVDLVDGHIDVPAGKTPVVLTFDDSSSGQFRLLPDGQVDPDCAVGIILDLAQKEPERWRPRATFFVLLDVDVPDRVLFGQPEWAEEKLRRLVAWGMEVGSHTISHFDLGAASPDRVRWQLAVSENTLERLIPGYEVRSLSIPFGSYPADLDLIRSGEWEGQGYDYAAAVKVGAEPAPSPFSSLFDPYYIPRIQAIQSELDLWFAYFEEHPERRYISDGDPQTVSFPEGLPASVYGELRPDLSPGLAVQRYPPAKMP
ncbi:MAG: polysaccharide deacetylase family protein [Chloroflexia bacterium]